jgi:hypothetical protein
VPRNARLAQIGSRLVDAAADKVAGDFLHAFNEKMAERRGAGAIEAVELARRPGLAGLSYRSLVALAAILLAALFLILLLARSCSPSPQNHFNVYYIIEEGVCP